MVDWERFGERLDGAAESAGQRADARLASDVARVTRFTEEEVARWFPDEGDTQRLAELVQIVKKNSDRNSQIQQVTQNIERLAGVVVTLLGKLL